MRVVLSRQELKQLPLVGLPAGERMVGRLALLAPISVEEGEGQDDEQQDVLHIVGIFPLLEANWLEALIERGRNRGSFLWRPEGRPDLSICFTVAGAKATRNRGYIRGFPEPRPLANVADLGEFSSRIHICNARRLAEQGVLIQTPGQVWIEDQVQVGPGSVIGPCVTLAGSTILADGVEVQQGSLIRDCNVEQGAVIKAYSVLESATVGKGAIIGPFANVRPGSQLGDRVRIGNFVETKKVTMGEGSKASHLAYLGDAVIGRDCNIGAGTITCNYDGFNKSLTQLGDRVFIGSDSQLVAPVSIGDDGYVAAGSTITKDVPEGALGIARGRQVTKEKLAYKIRDKARRKKEASS